MRRIWIVRLLWIIGAPCAVALAAFLWWMEEVRSQYGFKDWLLGPPTLGMISFLEEFFKYMSPPLALLTTALAIIGMIQQETSLQRSVTRWLYAKAAFWYVVVLAYYVSRSVLWWIVDVAVVSWILVTTIDLFIRLTQRYLFSHRGWGEVFDNPSTPGAA